MYATSAAPILIVDEDAHYRDVLNVLLTAEGYVVHLVTDTTAAAELLRDSPPDVVIFDLPSTNPRAVWRAFHLLQRDPLTPPIPALLCSAHAPLLHDVAHHLEAMGCQTIAKPFHRDHLLATIRTLLDSSVASS